jgi:hypothetical protein
VAAGVGYIQTRLDRRRAGVASCPVVEALALVVSLLSAATAILALVRSQEAVKRTEALERKRDAGRNVVGAAIAAGNQLVADLAGADRSTAAQRWPTWEEQARAAVAEADPAQLGRYDLPMRPGLTVTGMVKERQAAPRDTGPTLGVPPAVPPRRWIAVVQTDATGRNARSPESVTRARS